jgi:NNP family nitrate/nitrite transporter-like MFS transporter
MAVIMQEYNVGHAMADMLILFAALPAIFISIPSGVLVDRYGIKALGLIGLILLCVGGLLSATAISFLALVVGRLAIGMGGAITFVSAVALIPRWFPPEQRGLAMGIFGANMPLATIISFNILGRIGVVSGWRYSLWISLIASVIVLLLWALLVKERRSSVEEMPPKLSFSGLRNKQIWLLGLIWGTFNMGVLSFTTWGPKLFTDFWGMSPTRANFLASMLMMLALLVPLTGYISDRLGKRRIFIMISAVGMTISFALIPAFSGASLFLIVAFLGLVAAFLPPATFALPAEILGQSSVGLGYGVLNACLNAGIVMGPLMVGVMLDLTTNVTAVFSSMAIFAILPLLLAFRLKTG